MIVFGGEDVKKYRVEEKKRKIVASESFYL